MVELKKGAMRHSAPRQSAGGHAGSVAADAVMELLRATGERVTAPRLAVLRVLLGADQALSLAEVEQALAGEAIDHVTLYRVLDWLTAQGLAHRITGDARVPRFGASRQGQEAHAHFTCNQCSRVYCLTQVSQPKLRMPKGFHLQGLDLTVKGVCAACTV